VCLPAYTRLGPVIERIRRMFDLDADPGRITRHLASDGGLAPLLNRLRGVRLPGAWDGFEVAVYRVVLRDVGLSTAGRVMERLASTCGRHLEPRPPREPHILFPDAGVLAQSGSSNLGLSRRGAQDLRRLATATAAGSIQFLTASFDDLIAQLTTAARFDTATAHWIAMRSLAEPDAAPFGIEDAPLDTEHQRWRPWRSYVAVCHASVAIAASARRGAEGDRQPATRRASRACASRSSPAPLLGRLPARR
jgi:3-methyladenine DNA glycosylase/8-oxoguanine DNA glycosylase